MTTRLFVSDRLSNGAKLTLDADQAHYLGRVLRIEAGSTISVFNGNDGEFRATVDSLRKKQAILLVREKIETNLESPFKIHLVQGVSRGERMDFVVQKATELGVKRITPVLTDHGVVRLDPIRGEKRRAHWQRVAESACEQCGRVRPPLVDAPISLNKWFGANDVADATQLILTLGANSRPMTAMDAPPVKLCLLLGPEGGFSESELDDAALAGFEAVSLGPRVLRTETAALTAVAIAQSLWGDLRPEPTPRPA